MAGKYDQVLQRIADRLGVDEGDEDIAALKDANPLRQRIGELENEVKEGTAAKQELAGLKRRPKVEQVLTKVGVDLANLSKAERHVLEGLDFEGDEPTEEWAAEQVERFGLPRTEVEETEEEVPAAGRIAAQAQTSAANSGKAPVLTTEQVERWDSETWMRFEKQHPELVERFLQGEQVPMPSGFTS